ncbi:MAG: hypothetical protein RLZZ293_1448 [Pseudomonadota bacterium]|jgi:phosphatidylinositol glycan class B
MSIPRKYLYYAVIIYLITAFFSLGHLHPDEYYQILEFAAFKLHLNSPHGLTWEFYDQIRSAFQAWIIVYLYKLIALVNQPNPFFVAFLSRVLAGILSLFSVVLFIDCFKHELKQENYQRWFILLSLFSWIAIFNGIRFSSENVSAKLFIIGLCWLINPCYNKKVFSYFLIGLCLGMSFIARFQVGFMIVGLMAWLLFIQRIRLSTWLAINLGIFTAIGFGILIDHWFYSNWVFTPWRYFEANLLQGKAASFGIDPWYMYLSIAGMVPYGPLYIVGTIYFILSKRLHVITWVMLPFLVVHLLVGHKELRFLTPLLSFMPLVILASVQQLINSKKLIWNYKLQWLNRFSWRFNCFVVMVVMFVPSAMQIRINQLMYNRYQQATAFNYITEGGNILDFYKHLNLRPVPIQEPKQLDCKDNENCVIALTCQETLKYGAPKGKLIFSDCPTWIFKLDFNGWLERTALYNIYEIRNLERK